MSINLFFAPILVMETSDNHPNKDLALTATSYWTTLPKNKIKIKIKILKNK
jgi:hypothetical protein